MTDAELLLAYTNTRSEDAFRTLIARYINLVYSACLRQLRNSHLAEDATQAVFILLSQRAVRLPQVRLASWLLTASRFTCANIRKTELRRGRREQVVAMLQNKNAAQSESKSSETDPDLLNLLDQALSHLNRADREAVALRYLQQTPLRDVGLALGISEEAARKRINRALDKLRSYFIRHGIATSSAALATLLPTQAHAAALTPSLTESLTHSILQTCHAGVSSPALAIAKGTKLMMLANTAKTATVATLLAAILIAAGWGGWTLSRRAQAQPATPIAAPVTPLDLSTPEKALESYCNALKAGDRAGVYACTTTDLNRTPTAGDAFCSFNLAQNHLIRATAKSFNSTGEEARQFPTLDLFLSQILAYDRATQQPAIITGDTAILPFNLPDAFINKFPDSIQKQIRSFAGHPLHFTKQGNNWKLGMPLLNGGKNAEVTITLLDNNHQLVNDPDLQIKVVQEYAAAYDHVAADVEAAQYPTWDDAHTALKAEVEQLHKNHNLNDIEIQLAPPPQTPAANP